MVFEAVQNDNVYVDIKSIDRYSQSTLDVNTRFNCISCNSDLTYVNESSRCSAHFRHPSTEEARDCPYFSNDTAYEINKQYNRDEQDTVFVEKWQLQYSHYVCREDCSVYSLGSSKGLITILGDINEYTGTKYQENPRVTTPKVFILSGTRRHVNLYRTNDTENECIYFGRKCEIGYILQNNGIAAIDMGHDYIALVSSTDYLPTYYKTDDGKPILHMYPCTLMHINEFTDVYLPAQYPKPQRPSIGILDTLKNCKEELEREETEKNERERKRKEKLERDTRETKRRMFSNTKKDDRSISELILTMCNV